MRPNTKLIHVETPGNPTTGISDISAIAEIAHKGGSLLSIDATFAGPICLYPIKLGAEEAPWVCLTLLPWHSSWLDYGLDSRSYNKNDRQINPLHSIR